MLSLIAANISKNKTINGGRTQVLPSAKTQLSFGKLKLNGQIKSFASKAENFVKPLDTFARRHIGPQDPQIDKMLKFMGYKDLDSFTNDNVPKSIQLGEDMKLPEATTEAETLEELKAIAKKNKLFKSFIGMGYYGTITPPVILRNILENPGWYTPYTPYQAEISQGRLESLLNFQTMVVDLTGMDIANASLLDEGTAAAEAMYTCFQSARKQKSIFYIAKDVHPQTIGVVKTRASAVGVEIRVEDPENFDLSNGKVAGVLIQYPSTYGHLKNYKDFCAKMHEGGALVACASDLLALTILTPPGEFGADIVFGSAQRFGVPMGYGGPHAAFFATKDAYKRVMPGRLIGVSKDVNGDVAFRMSLQTREQHIRRETATSNICTAQALLANMAAMYAVYHGPEGLKKIAERTHRFALAFASMSNKLGFKVLHPDFFDTVAVDVSPHTADEVQAILERKKMNVRIVSNSVITASFDETSALEDLENFFKGFLQLIGKRKVKFTLDEIISEASSNNEVIHRFGRKSAILTHPSFNSYHSETEMLRYLKRLENKDLSLANCMIPLGSCTMKLNATSEMIPVTWPEFANLHPFVPLSQAQGYLEMFDNLSRSLCEVTGFDAVSLQPNSGAQGEYAGLRVIRDYQKSIGQGHRDICLIPVSAHGTNPASAALAGLKIVSIKTDEQGNVDVAHLGEQLEAHKDKISCLMVTYPSTFGVFEEKIKDICAMVHKYGGQVYMDGANMNSQVGLCSPGKIGADVCHLNLHKTFCIPHGGGGPGMGPIGVAKHLAPFLPTHPVVNMGRFGGSQSDVVISAAPFGSSAILPISEVYIRMMGAKGLKKATQMAILNANYMAKKLKDHYKIFYTNEKGLVAHEFILDFSPFKEFGIGVEDVAKRLMDYGFHAPTMAWPIHDTLMVEPTESEPLEEMDRFCEALIRIREEIREVEQGKVDPKNNPLVNAPHTAKVVMSDKWNRPYTREQAGYPVSWLKFNKYWPTVGRIDSVYGDRNLFCSCPPVDSYSPVVKSS